MIDTDNEYLEVRWNSPKDYDIHFKRFKRMGALLEWVEQNPKKTVGLAIYRKIKKEGNKND